MLSNCYVCGYWDNEVKFGGLIVFKGKRIILKVEDEEDFSWDMFKVSVFLYCIIVSNLLFL